MSDSGSSLDNSWHVAQVVESHQRSKVDTSGTAKAVIGSFRKLGIPFEEVCNCTAASLSDNRNRR